MLLKAKTRNLGFLPYLFTTHTQGWPEPYIYTVYDRTFCDFPATNTVYTRYIYGYGQPYDCVFRSWVVLDVGCGAVGNTQHRLDQNCVRTSHN